MNFNVTVDRTGEVLASFKTRPEAGRWINENFTEYRGKHKIPTCSLPYIVRIERAKPYDVVLYDKHGNERSRGMVESIARKLGVGELDMFHILRSKYMKIPHFMDWYVEREYS